MIVMRELSEILSGVVFEVVNDTDVIIALERPSDSSFGDYTSNIAMVLAKRMGKSPVAVADDIAARLRRAAHHILDTDPHHGVVVAGPGFINITLSREARATEIAHTSFQDFSTDIHVGKRVLVEHSSPNLFKPFHIGHLMNNTIGESVTRLMRASGATVNTTSFPSDISLGIAKAVWAELHNMLPPITKPHSAILEISPNSFNAKIAKKAGDLYVIGTAEYEKSEKGEDKTVVNEVKEIANILYKYIENKDLEFTASEQKIITIYKNYSEGSKNYLFSMLSSLMGSTFDSFIYESESGIRGSQTVREFTPAVFTESEGAIVYIPAEDRKDINTAVFINSQGNPTYEAKDVGLIDLKFERYHPDISLFVTDTEQIPHFRVVLAAYADIEATRAQRGEAIANAIEKSQHIAHGRMSFKGQKMSSRLGGVPTAEDMINAVREEVIERLRDEQKSDDQLATNIAIGAIKFAILRVRAGQNINFDPDTSLSFEGDSGPYLMYTHARIRSVIEKANAAGISLSNSIPENWQVTDVEKQLIHFAAIIERAQAEYAPHHIVVYLLQLAQAYNSWYGNTKMIDTDNAAGYRIYLSQKVADAIKRGLYLLGITAPDRM
jgi:arginyl-tRNA synthetase